MEFAAGIGAVPEYFLLLLGTGFLVGVINTFAGSGTVISYYVFMALGLSVGDANGTNRLGVVAQTFSTSWIFFRQNLLEVRTGVKLSIPTVAGTLIGAQIAVNIPEEVLEKVIAFFMILMVFSIFFKPEKWMEGKERKVSRSIPWFQYVIFFLIGIYGGFIHIGVGIFMLAALVLISGFDLLKANALKVFIVFVYSPFALAVFMWNGHVDYAMGLISSVGNLFGGVLAARLSINWGTRFLRWILSIIIVLFIADLIGIFRLFGFDYR